MFFLQKHPKYKWTFAVGDYCSVVLGPVLTIGIAALFDTPANLSLNYSVVVWSMVIAALQVLLFQIIGLYHIQTVTNVWTSAILLTKGMAVSFLALVLMSVFLNVQILPLQYYALAFLCSLALIISIRGVILSIIQHTNLLSDRVIIIGAGRKGQVMLNSLSTKLKVKKPIGFIDDNISAGEQVNGLPVLGKVFDSHTIAKDFKVNFFVMAIDNISREQFFKVLNYFNENNLTIYITSNYLKVLHGNLEADTFNKYGLIRIGHPAQSDLLILSKRMFDVVMSVIGIILISPLLVLLAMLIKATSKGPIIYKQTRIGKEGRPFTFYKFRSMRVNSDQDTDRGAKMTDFIKGKNTNGNASTKIVNTKKITSIGKIIRKTSLDELPQLFNVLKGDMSLVGPRPCLPLEWSVYEPWQKQRLMFMPGCTGLWQVTGRSKVNFEESVIMDLYYNCNVSLWLDVKIIANTIPVMLFSRGGE